MIGMFRVGLCLEQLEHKGSTCSRRVRGGIVLSLPHVLTPTAPLEMSRAQAECQSHGNAGSSTGCCRPLPNGEARPEHVTFRRESFSWRHLGTVPYIDPTNSTRVVWQVTWYCKPAVVVQSWRFRAWCYRASCTVPVRRKCIPVSTAKGWCCCGLGFPAHCCL